MFSPMFLLQTIWDKFVNGPIREPIFVIHLLPGDSFANKSFQDNREKNCSALMHLGCLTTAMKY